MEGASRAVKIRSGATVSDKEAWRKAGYAAIDRMIEFLGDNLSSRTISSGWRIY